MKSIIILYLGHLCCRMCSSNCQLYFQDKSDAGGKCQRYHPPSGITEVLKTLGIQCCRQPGRRASQCQLYRILTWALLQSVARDLHLIPTKSMLSDVAEAVSQVVRWVIKFAPLGVMGLVFNALPPTALKPCSAMAS